MNPKDRQKLFQLKRRLEAVQKKHAAADAEDDRLQENRDELKSQLQRIGDLSLGKAKRPGTRLRPGVARTASLDRKYATLLKKDTRLKAQIESLAEVREKLSEQAEAIKDQIKKVGKGASNPGKRGLRGATPKQKRQYEAIKKSERKSGRSLKESKRIAAATVRKRANKTIIKARTIKHLDVSKVHNRTRKRNAATLPRSISTIKGEYDPARLRKQRDQLRTNIQSYAGLIKKLTKEIQSEKSPTRVGEIRRQLKDLDRLEQREVSQLDRVLTALGATEGISRRAFKNKTRKRNPPVSSKSKSNFRKFHGRPSKKALTVLAPKGTPPSIAISGPLKLIKTRKVIVAFHKHRNPGSDVMLAEGDNGQLYIVAKGDHLPHGPEPLTDYGPIEQVEYIAKKPHLGYPQTTEFYHKFGEETGVKPHLETNAQGEYVITGGEYYVTDRGIENPRSRKRPRRRKR